MLQATELWRCADAELLDRLADIERIGRRAHAAMLRVVGEIDTRGIAGELGYRHLESLLGDRLAITRPDAKQRVRHAAQLTQLPVAAAAADAGVLHPDQIAAITDTIRQLPPRATTEDHELVERTLVEGATHSHAGTLRRWGHQLHNRIDQDGPEPYEAELAKPRNELRYTVRDGWVYFKGRLHPESGALLTSMLSSLGTPRATEGERDLRDTAERYGDAMADILTLAADTGQLPEDGGQKPHLTVTIDWNTLREQTGRATLEGATLDGATSLTASQARRIACDAHILPIVLGSRSQPLDVGRSTRTIPTAIRKALVIRDRGCSFPSCDRPPQWTDAHHITSWIDGGPTELGNLTLLCRQHHTLIHHSAWRIEMDDGIPTFIPPRYVDRDQKPRTNPLYRYDLIS
ncbi:MAG TPA: DUF222 domain-containing protein [Pseudonocardiaceae bacterium]|nr:DUF222 domain-containing protein [Pseudonocardiaceae bacterium]